MFIVKHLPADELPTFPATHAISHAESAWESYWFRIRQPEQEIN